MKTKKLVSTIIVVFAATFLFSLPKEDARYIYIKKYYRLNKDGSWSVKVNTKVKLNTYLAIRRIFGESFIVYNLKYQRVKVLKSLTTMLSGEKVPTPENGYNEVLLRAAHGFSDFNNIRELVVSHTGLERGAVVDFEYEVLTDSKLLSPFFTVVPLEEKAPSDETSIFFDIPEEKSLYFTFVNSSFIEPEIKSVSKRKVYKFVFKNVNRRSSSYGLNYADLKYLIASTGENFGSVKELILNGKLPSKFLKDIDKIKTESSNLIELSLKIKKQINNTIDDVRIGVDKIGINIRPLFKVISSHYGTSLEKSSILYNSLKYLGYKPEIVIFSPYKDLKVFTGLSRIFIKVGDNYISVSEEQPNFYPYGYEGFYAFNLNKNSFENVKEVSFKDNFIKISGKLFVGKDKESRIFVKTAGYFNDYERLLGDELSFVNRLLSKTIGIRAKKILKTSKKDDKRYEAEVLAEGLIPEELYDGIFSIKSFKVLDKNKHLNPGLVFSDYPVRFKAPFCAVYELELVFPLNLKVDWEAEEDIDYSKGFLVLKRKIEKTGEGKRKVYLKTCFMKNKFYDKNSLKYVLFKLEGDVKLFLLVEGK